MKNKIIINADDYGISHDVNEAISLCFEKNYINQTTIMVNMPCLNEAVELAKKNRFDNKVGLHLNLVEGVPLTEDIKSTVLCNDKGIFDSRVMKTPKYRMRLDKKTSYAVAAEIEAQINVFLNLGIGIRHLDSHQHSHVNPSILKILLPILEQYNFCDLRLSRNLPVQEMTGLKRILKSQINAKIHNYNLMHTKTSPVNFGSMNDVSKSRALEGFTEMMVHPIIIDGELKEAFLDETLLDWWKKNFNFFELV